MALNLDASSQMYVHSLSIYIANHRNANIIEGGLICKQPHPKHINLKFQHCCTAQNPGMKNLELGCLTVHNSASNVSMAHYFENPSDRISFGLFIYHFLPLLKVHDSGKNVGRHRSPYLPTLACNPLF